MASSRGIERRSLDTSSSPLASTTSSPLSSLASSPLSSVPTSPLSSVPTSEISSLGSGGKESRTGKINDVVRNEDGQELDNGQSTTETSKTAEGLPPQGRKRKRDETLCKHQIPKPCPEFDSIGEAPSPDLRARCNRFFEGGWELPPGKPLGRGQNKMPRPWRPRREESPCERAVRVREEREIGETSHSFWDQRRSGHMSKKLKSMWED